MDDKAKVAINRVLGHEGGYVNNPMDPGGETNWGITSRVARKWGYKGDMRFLPRETAVEIYEKEYWESSGAYLLPFPLAFQVFDAAVNSGPLQAAKWLQRTLGVPDDGVIGPQTIAAAKTIPSSLMAGIKFIATRGKFQARLPTWPAFGKGWANRNYDNLEFLLQDSQNGA